MSASAGVVGRKAGAALDAAVGRRVFIASATWKGIGRGGEDGARRGAGRAGERAGGGLAGGPWGAFWRAQGMVGLGVAASWWRVGRVAVWPVGRCVGGAVWLCACVCSPACLCAGVPVCVLHWFRVVWDSGCAADLVAAGFSFAWGAGLLLGGGDGGLGGGAVEGWEGWEGDGGGLLVWKLREWDGGGGGVLEVGAGVTRCSGPYIPCFRIRRWRWWCAKREELKRLHFLIVILVETGGWFGVTEGGGREAGRAGGWQGGGLAGWG